MTYSLHQWLCKELQDGYISAAIFEILKENISYESWEDAFLKISSQIPENLFMYS